tara:strand:- start:224 stop:346 length:123 start_codon:yes stop_codon:yes gene_type:complete
LIFVFIPYKNKKKEKELQTGKERKKKGERWTTRLFILFSV